MKTQESASLYKGYRFPAEIISHCVWLYFRFSLSFRDVEEIMAERGVMLTYETIRQWCLTFGQQYANEVKRSRPRTGDKWHLDEVFLKINGKTHYLWRAIDQYGNILDILVQSRRNKQAAKKFFRKLLKGLQYVPRVIITDKLASYGAAKRELLASVEHRQHKGLNNRAENSHQPTRQRERTMRRFKTPGHAQRFLSAFGPISNHFRPKRHRLHASDYRALMQDRFQIWNAHHRRTNRSVAPCQPPRSFISFRPLVILLRKALPFIP
ncbi:IS6 family transposase [Ktedonobacter sp. SOSP1-52]|nr:IS6 family transposase [Ktedonobacter sp. SOSP1-52]